MSKVTGKAVDLGLFNRMLGLSRPYRKILYFAIAITVFLAFLGIVRPYLIGESIDKYVVTGDRVGLLQLTLVVVVLLFVEAVAQFYETYYSTWLGQTVTIDLRSKLYSHISAFKLRYFDRTPIGTLVTRVISDIETIAEVFSSGLLQIIGDVLKLLVVIAVMFLVNWKLTLYSMAPIPVLLIATRIFQNAVKKAFQAVRFEVARLNAFVQEHLTGMSVVQVFNREKVEFDKFQDINRAHRTAHIKSVWAYSIFFPVVDILSAVSLAFLVWWGVGGVLENEVSFGELVAFILYINMLYRPIRQLADRFNVLQMGMVGAERVFNLLDLKDERERSGSDKPEIRGNLRFENVWFAYNDDEYVLRDVSFSIQEGETVAIVGPTGAGKTSIINLVNGFYEFQKGRILVDGTDIREMDLAWLRQHVGVVLQDVFLFSDTIMANITLRNPHITEQQVIDAARAVGAHRFIDRLPGGYNYHVKERGGMLSVGQRQLIAFIRAYVYNPSILILDEATSSVDTESEMLIQQAIDTLTQNRTSIIIAHRLSTVQKAHRIMVMEKGKVIETGNHQQLLALNGRYRRMFDLQYVEA